MRVIAIASLISVLNVFGCPPAIKDAGSRHAFVTLSAGVTSFGVDPVECVFRARGNSHISKESKKRFSPSFANVCSECPVISVIVHVGVVASSFHFGPNGVFPRLGFAAAILFSASATLRNAPLPAYILSENCIAFATRTFTVPTPMMFRVFFGHADDCYESELLTC
jgi:hypothetical protein